MNNNWEIKTIGELCNLATGGTPSRVRNEYFDGGQIKWLVSGDIHQKEIYDCEGRITESGYTDSNAKYLPINSVLIALNGQGKTRGTVALLRVKATCNQSLVSIYPKDLSVLLPEYLYRVLDGRYDEIRKMTGDAGNERRGLNMPLIRSIKIGLPPLSEQKRIVKILDEKFGAIEELKRVTEQQIADAKELFESRLDEVFEKLTKKLMPVSFSEVCTLKSGNTISIKLERKNGDLLYVKVGDMNLKGNEVKITTSSRFASKEDIPQSHRIPKGAIIFPKRGGAILTNKKRITESEIVADLNIMAAIPHKDVLTDYLFYWFKTFKLEEISNGAAILQINNYSFDNLTLPKPLLSEQEESVTELNELSEKTKELETIFRKKIADLVELKKSYLEQAFSGNL